VRLSRSCWQNEPDRAESAAGPDQSQPRNPCFCVQLGTIAGDNQPNTYPKVRLPRETGFGVISDWDETVPGFEAQRLLRNPKRNPDPGDDAVAISLKEEFLVRSESVVARVVAGETLIVPIRAKVGDLASIYSFNGTGSLIWKLLESPKSVAQLATAVAQAFDVEPAQAEQDVTNFVSEMKSVGLVEVPAAAFVAMAGD
jgi:hypothetical protein